jgi:hypothetical protein
VQNRFVVYTRDPLSARFDLPARRLVEEAYEVRGEWAGMILAPPGPRARQWMYAHGINPYERDRWGELRFIRSFKRSVFWQVKWYGGLYGLRATANSASGGAESNWGAPVRVQWQTGVQVDTGGPLKSWAVRIRLHEPGDATRLAGRRDPNRWIDDAGHPTFRQSNPAYGDRPWE